MARAKPVVTSAAAAAALSVRQGVELEVASDAQGFASKVLMLMDPTRADAMGRLARSRVVQDYAWSASLKLLDELVQRGSDTSPAAVCAATTDLRYALPAK
jgi:glycosyltransferase involved in cell wall biosynthesis